MVPGRPNEGGGGGGAASEIPSALVQSRTALCAGVLVCVVMREHTLYLLMCVSFTGAQNVCCFTCMETISSSFLRGRGADYHLKLFSVQR